MADKKIIEPIILRGTRDFTPQQMIRRNAVMDTLRRVFEQFGYTPLETPILSPAETILGKYGEEGDRLTYTFTDRGGRQIALPYDLTVPFARYFAANWRELPVPFKRYQIQRVWRAERPQKGRLREFYQCDIDIIGSDDMLCEVEIAKVIVVAFERLGIENITIKINSRPLLNDVLRSMNVSDEQTVPAIRIIDKLDKIGEDGVVAELEEAGIGNAKALIEALKPAATSEETIKKLATYDTSDIQKFLELCREFDISEEKFKFDPTLARGLDYYTGLIFEVVSADSDFGTICAGGRYDNLCGLFTKQNFSGMGVAFGFERIMLLLEEKGAFEGDNAISQVLVTRFGEESIKDPLRLYNALIEAGIPAEIYLGSEKLGQQIKFADKKRIPFVVIQGPQERANGEVTVRRMDTGKQKTIPASQLVAYIDGFYQGDHHHNSALPPRA